MSRRVSVYLDLETAAYNRGAAEVATVTRGTKAQLKEFGDQADDASRDLDQLAANTVVASKGIDKLGDQARGTAAELALLDNRIKAAERSVASLGLRFAQGDSSVEQSLNSERSMLGQLRRVRRELEAGFKVPRASSGTWFGGFDFSNFVAEFRGVGIAALVGLAVLLAPAIGAMISGAVVGSVAGGGIIGGIIAAAHDQRVQQAWAEFTPILNSKAFGADFFVDPVIEGIHKLKSLVQDLDIGDTLALGVPGLNELINGLDLFVRNAWPAFSRLMGSSESIMRVFSVGLAGTGSALNDFLTDVMDSQGTLEGLAYLFMVLNGTIRFLGEALKWLGNAFSGIVRLNAWLTGNAEDIFGWVPWLGTRIREMNDNMETIAGTGTITANVSKAVASAIAEIGPPAETTAEAIARVNKEYEELHRNAIGMIDANIAFQQSLDDLAESVNKNGSSLDVNTQQGRENTRMLLDGVKAADTARQNAIDRGVYTATANALYEDQIELLIKQAKEYGLNEDAVRRFITALGLVPPVTTAQLILEMEARGIVPGEHSGPRIGDNPDYTGSGGTAADAAAERGATGRVQPESNQDPWAQFFADRAEGKKAAGGGVLAGRLYQVNEQQLEYFQPLMSGMVMPLTGAARGWDGATGGGIDYDRLAAALANLTVYGVATLDGRAVGEFTAGYQTDLALKRPRL